MASSHPPAGHGKPRPRAVETYPPAIYATHGGAAPASIVAVVGRDREAGLAEQFKGVKHPAHVNVHGGVVLAGGGAATAAAHGAPHGGRARRAAVPGGTDD